MKRLFTSFLALGVAAAATVSAADSPVWKALSAGDNTSYGIKADGTLWAWGDNEEGQLGSGFEGKWSSTPLQIGTENTWKAVYGARSSVYCLKEDGTIWTAGRNEKGMSGVGDGMNKHTEIVQIGTDSDWASLSVSNGWCYTVFGIKTDGSLWAWGSAETFCLGTGTTQNSAVPVRIGTDNDWKQISIGSSHVLALKKDGSLYGWGNANYNQLMNSESNIKVPTLISNEKWEAVYAIDNASYGVKTDGTLWAWGENDDNLLGFNDTMPEQDPDSETEIRLANVLEPRQITAFEGEVSMVSGCDKARVALVGGKVYTWGSNANGALGDGKGGAYDGTNFYWNYAPTAVELPEGVEPVFVQSGLLFTVLLDSNGTAYGWGSNRWGQMGNYAEDNNLSFETTPIAISVPTPPKPGEYTVDASEIPSSLADAVRLTLTGEWGTAEFQKLCVAIGANLGFPPMGNTTLVSVDMSAATIKPETSMFVTAGMQDAGVFKMCKALESVKFPVNETAANIVSLRECFQNCEKLTACDVSALTGVTNIIDAFYNTAVSAVDMSGWTSVAKSEDAFGKCSRLSTVVLPADFTIGKYLFNSCEALRLVDWSKYAGEEAPAIPSSYNVFEHLTAEQQAQITVMVPAAVYESFKAGETWAYVNLQAVQAVEEGTYRIDASSIPDDLSDAVRIYLSGYWDTAAFKALSNSLGNNTGTGSSNSVLKLVDMSAAEIAVATNLVAEYPGALWGTVEKGIFQSCKALETVVMPAAGQAENFRSFKQAFQLCDALAEIDLSGCTGLNNMTDCFYNCTSLAKAVLPGNFVFSSGTFDRCNALATIDWTLFEGTEAPAFKSGSVPTRGKALTIIVPDAAYDSFTANASWNAYNIVKASTSGIDLAEAESNGVREVYTLSGVHVATLGAGEPLSDLPAGLYIVGGRKVLVK